MEHKEVKLKEVEEVVNISCNCCGKSCGVPGEPHTMVFMTMQANWGYYSNKDLQSWKAHICEACVDEHFLHANFEKINSINGKPLKNE